MHRIQSFLSLFICWYRRIDYNLIYAVLRYDYLRYNRDVKNRYSFGKSGDGGNMNDKIIYGKIKDLIPKNKIDALYLFGSYSDGTFTEDSDVDLAIFSYELSYIELVDLEDKISTRLKKDVDLVLPEKDNVLLLREILISLTGSYHLSRMKLV